jgi:quinoprotein glucose dehydrogenase
MADDIPDIPEDDTRPARRGYSWAALIVGIVVALIGLVLTVGGAWLVSLGGSPYYVVAGVTMLVGGALLAWQRMLGGWIYIAVFVGTLIWAFWEAGANAWPLVPRVIAPIVLLIAVLLAMPTLSRAAHRWRNAWGAVVAVLVIAVVGGWIIAKGDEAPVLAALPAADGTMADPSLLKTGADWPAYGGTYSARRYSPLAQINTGNVDRLERVWLAHTGDMPDSREAAGMYGAETTPLKVGDSLYICTPMNMMLALEPATGKIRWRFDPHVDDKWIPYTAACRGVSYYAVPGAAPDSLCATRIIEGTLDARLIAVDARTGKPCPGFGSNGQVDTKIGMGDIYPGMVSITSAPTIVRGVIVTGHQILDGQKRWAPSGVIQGYDAVTGELRWAWDMMHPDWTGSSAMRRRA